MNQQKSQHAILVDPFSSGQFLVDEFNRRGIPCVAVLSNGKPAALGGSFRPEKYAAVIEYGNDMAALVATVREFNPLCVMMGLETGVALMDRLAADLGLPGNDPHTSGMRRDKYLMQEAIRAEGLRAVEQCKVDHVDQARAWLEKHGRYPVVVKPAESAGSDNINMCKTIDEALAAVLHVLGSVNLFGAANSHALVQEYLDGQEWVVDTVSCEGECFVTNVTKYKKVHTPEEKLVYRHSAFLAPDPEAHGELISYAKNVATALGIDFGAAHIELIATARGPVLVEVNARMHGGDAVTVLKDYATFTQLELSVDANIAPDDFRRKAQLEVTYSHHVIAHFLISRLVGKVNNVMAKPQLGKIDSYAGDHMPGLGETLRITDSLTSAPGYIWLANVGLDALNADQDTLIEWEQQGLLYS
jgi:biotin carboxylase